MAEPTQLEAWLKDFPREEAEGRIRELERELASWRNALALYDSFQASSNGGPSTEPSPDKPPNRPAAIRRVLREGGNQPMLPGKVKETMLSHGWLKESQVKLFYSAMSTMTKRGHLLRLHDGRYMLPQGALGGKEMN